MSIISVRGLSRSYRTKHTTVSALSDIDLEIDSGDFLAIMGASGSGKSTLIQLLGGLDTPTSGQIVIDGTDITKLSDKKLARFRNQTFGFVFQNFYLQPFLTVKQNIELPAVFANLPTVTRAKRTEILVRSLGIEDKLSSLPRELSGGQIQRVAVLRAIYNKPLIIFADEPTGNLDKKNSIAVLELLKMVNAKLKTTVILVTHDELASRYASRVIRLDEGKIV